MPGSVVHLRCLVCGATYAPQEVDYVCPEHGREGILDVEQDRARTGRASRTSTSPR